MSLQARFVLVVVVLAVCARSAISIAGPHAGQQSVDFNARVLKVSEGKTPRATIDKGKKAGLKLGDTGELYGMRLSEGSTTESVDFLVRHAVGRVVEITDTGATITLEAIGDPVTAGAYFLYKVKVPEELAQSSLFRVTALGIELRTQGEDKPIITVEEMLADPSQAVRDKALDTMIADIKQLKSVIVDTLKGRIEEGQHHGKLAGQIIDELGRAELLDFLLFVESFPGKYIGHRWKVPEVYFTWVINGTPSGEADHKLRLLSGTIKAAEDAQNKGKLDEARVAWQAVLHELPDHKDATAAVARIDNILLLMRTVADDPDDTASRYKLADELATLDASDLALKEIEALQKNKYEPFKVERLRSQVLTRQHKWKDAAAAFQRLIKDHPDDKGLPIWLRYISAHARLEAAPTDATAHGDLAQVDVEWKSWEQALTQYWYVLESKTATAKQREAARAAQPRISMQKELEKDLEWARGKIREHDVTHARERLAETLRLADKLGDSKQAGTALDDLANLARSSSEEDLALELFTKRVVLVPDEMSGYTALAYALLGFDRLDEAEAAVKKGLEKKGDTGYAELILSYIAFERDDLAAAEKFAQKAASDPKYAWPLLMVIRAEVARGDWDEATNHAKRALELEDQYAMRVAHSAVALGRQAFEALQADPTSARERLRLVRALAQLGLAKRAAEELAKLPADNTWRSDGWWALADSPDDRLLLRDRLVAARNAKPTTAIRKRQLALLEARAQLRAHPKDDATRLVLAQLYVKGEDYDRALATLVPLMTATMTPAVGDLVRDAREALAIDPQSQLARDALARLDFDGATKLALAYQKLHDRIGTPQASVSARDLRAYVLAEQGQYAQALALAQEAKAIGVADGDLVSASFFERRIQALRSQFGDSDTREAALEEGRKLCDGLDDQNCSYSLYLELAGVHLNEGRTAIGLEETRTAWKLAERLGRTDLERNARFSLADANLTANRFNDAEQLALSLLADSRKAKDVDNEQYSLMVLGAVATMRGAGKIARGRFQEVYELGTRTGKNSWRALARRFEGASWLEADHDPVKAAIALQQASTLYATLGDGWASENRGTVLRQLADAHLQAGKLADARTDATQGLALAQHFQRLPGLVSSHWILALVAIKEGKADEALTQAREAVAGADKTDDEGLTWSAYHSLGQALALKGQDKDSAEAYDKALDHLSRALVAAGGDDAARKGFMSAGRVRDVYKEATQLYLKLGNPKRAMEILEASRDALLKQALDPTKIHTKDTALRAQLDKYDEKRAHVKGLQDQLDKATNRPAGQRSDAQVKALGERVAKTKEELNQVALALQKTNGQRFRGLAMNPTSLNHRRTQLPKDSVLVEYFVAEDALYAFVISAGLTEPAVVRVKVTSTELETTVADYRRAILAEDAKVKHRDQVEELGRKLDGWLLEPLRDHLAGASTVIILPFGPLYYVPFDALVVSAAGAPVRYAIEDYRISIQTSATLDYLFGPTRARATGTMLAVSNPDGSLPGAALEVNRIVKTALPDAQVLGKTATVKKFSEMVGGYRYVHLATHGILDGVDPGKSFMKLADGPLTVEMIVGLAGLDQSNEMVVLSACDTAVAKGNSTGDELVSIASAFSSAGSPALVASLWAVSDDSTAELMAAFYRALEENSHDRLDALRNAKLNVLRLQRGKDTPFAAPWHWSGFQLYGDFRAPTAAAK